MSLLPFNFIGEGSEATPGLWNSPLSVLSANIAGIAANQGSGLTMSVLSDVSIGGGVFTAAPSNLSGAVTIHANSNVTDYLSFTDSSNARSNYLFGSHAGGTADGLNIYDASGSTMIVSFSKQSIRFYQQVVGPVFDVGGALASTYNAATFGSATDSTESRIQAAINQAAIDSIARVYLPASMQSFSASSVSFIYSIQMVGEGTDWTVWDTRVYGVKGNGTKDDRGAIQECENSRPAYGTLRFASGRTYLINTTYDGTTSEASKLLKVRNPGVWDLNGSQVRWGSSHSLVAGTDGAGLGMINALKAPWSLLGFGTLDGQSQTLAPLCFKDDQSGFFFMTEIRNLRETNGVWDGTLCTVSTDVTGTSFTTRAKNISGILRRPSCAMTPDGSTIADHADVTAFFWGGSVTNEGNHTSHVLVLNDSKEPIVNCFPGLIGVPQFVFNNTHNVVHADFSACDVGNNCLETQGFVLANAWSSVSTLGHAIKNGSVSGWFDYNVISSSTRLPNVSIQGGSAQSQGLIYLNGSMQAVDGAAKSPPYAFTSEASLGWYRSANSIMALSYGTLQADYVSTNSIVAESGGTVSVFSGLRVMANSANQMFLQAAGSGNYELRQTAGQFQLVDAGAVVVTATGAGNGIFIQTNASGTNRMILRSGGTIEVLQPFLQASGTAIAPSYALSSEFSLGWYRSGASTMGLSYGGLSVKAGTNASSGTAVLGSNGSVNVATNYVAAGDMIFLTDQTAGGTLGSLSVGGIRAASGFTILSSNIADTSTIAWWIVRPS